MSVFDFIKGELLEIIDWTDDSRDTLSYRFPDDDKAIKNGAQLIVRESQVAQFVYLGEFGDTFGPGKHRLTTDNIPVLTRIKSWPYGFNSPFKADVYYVITRLFTGNKWGTSNPVMLRDADFGAVRVSMSTMTERPGRSLPSALSAGIAIRTGTRCTILVKLPVAFSGGRSENCEPDAGATLSTVPSIVAPSRASTYTFALSPATTPASCVSLRFAST